MRPSRGLSATTDCPGPGGRLGKPAGCYQHRQTRGEQFSDSEVDESPPPFELRQDGYAAEHACRNDQHHARGGQGDGEPVAASAEPGQRGHGNHEQANDGADQPVRVLDQRLKLERRDDLAVAEGPVRAAQPGLRDSDDASEGDLPNGRDEGRDRHGAEHGGVAHDGRESAGQGVLHVGRKSGMCNISQPYHTCR